MPGRKFNSVKTVYGFNGKRKDNEMYGEANSYDFGDRIYDVRIGRWLSVDPLVAKFPNEAPYIFAACNPIRFIDVDGQSASDPPFWIWFRETTLFGNNMMSIGTFQRSAERYGVPTTKPYVPRLGRIFEDAVLRSINKLDLKKPITPYPLTSPNTRFIPDVIENHQHKITESGNRTTGYKQTIYDFKDAIITDAKFVTDNKLYNTDQIRGFIDYLSDQRGVSINGVPTGEKNSDYGMATIIFATPSNVTIDNGIVEYAKKKNVNVYQRIAIQVTPNLTQQNDESTTVSYNKLKISEAFPVFVAPSQNNKLDRTNVDRAGGQGTGENVSINWRQE